MNRLNPVERECLEVLTEIRDLWTIGDIHRIGKKDFMEIMGDIRVALTHLTNKDYGCATGYHSGPCHCKWPYQF